MQFSLSFASRLGLIFYCISMRDCWINSSLQDCVRRFRSTLDSKCKHKPVTLCALLWHFDIPEKRREIWKKLFFRFFPGPAQDNNTWRRPQWAHEELLSFCVVEGGRKRLMRLSNLFGMIFYAFVCLSFMFAIVEWNSTLHLNRVLAKCVHVSFSFFSSAGCFSNRQLIPTYCTSYFSATPSWRWRCYWRSYSVAR